jgi:uncharacterized protein
MNTQSAVRTQDELFLEIVYLFIAPVVLIYLGVIPYEWRVIVLFIVSFLIMGIMRYQHWPKEKMGVAPIDPRTAMTYTVFTVLAAASIITLAQWLGYTPINLHDWVQSWRLILFFIPLSVLQEVAYRGFLSARLKELTNNTLHRVLINTGLFTLLHIIYPFPILVLPIVLIGGVCFAVLYERHPNLLAISIAHSALNFIAVLYGFFS